MRNTGHRLFISRDLSSVSEAREHAKRRDDDPYWGGGDSPCYLELTRVREYAKRREIGRYSKLPSSLTIPSRTHSQERNAQTKKKKKREVK